MKQTKATSKATGYTDFNLETLGWRNFQDLCAVILREVLGQTFKTFADSNDGGRDGAFAGIWSRPEKLPRTNMWKEVPSGETVVQCKFSAKSDATLTPSSISKELSKISKLVSKGICVNYILITNAKVSGTSEAKIVSSIRELGVKYVLVLDGKWIGQTISADQTLRMYVPRVYGLGDLSLILDERSEKQAKAILNQVDSLSTFVITDAYKKSADALREHSFVLLIGEPASGKSVIAAALSVAAIDQWKTQVIKVNNADDFIKHWNVDNKNQLFWVDDAFGVVKHDEARTDSWARNMQPVMAAIKNGAKIIMTSRDYIYREAQASLKEYHHPMLSDGKVIIHVEQITLNEKQRILYNHVRLGDQPKKFKTSLKQHLPIAAQSQHFLPEMARRIGTKAFTTQLNPAYRQDIVKFVEKPNAYLNGIFVELDNNHISALCLVFLANDLGSPLTLSGEQKNVAERLGGQSHKIPSALEALSGNIIRFVPQAHITDSQSHWSFHHPTLREAFASYIMRQPGLVDIIIDGLTLEESLTQLDCGDNPDSQGRLVYIPPAHYINVIKKLEHIDSALNASPDSSSRRRLLIDYRSFLARSSITFLEQYLKVKPQIIKECIDDIHSYLYISTANRLIVSLYNKGLLPEEQRKEVVKKYKYLAINTPDSGWWDTYANDLLNEEEIVEIIDEIKAELLPNLDSVIEEWQDNEDIEDAEYYTALSDALESYSYRFELLETETESTKILNDAYSEVSELRDEHEAKIALKDDYSSLYDDPRPSVDNISERSIFEDVDT